MKAKNKRNGVVVTPKAVTAIASVYPPKVWLSDNFAIDWLKDALNEAQIGKDFNSRRREIVFAICFLESYIFEWARHVLQIEEINDYFPPKPRFKRDPRYRRTLKNKWIDIPKELYDDGKIHVKPDLNISGLGTLLKYRHGLVHAAASRPATDIQKKETKPFPTKNDLKKLKPGWAVKIALDLVIQFHIRINSSPPEYVKEAACKLSQRG